MTCRILILFMFLANAASAAPVRIKDLVEFDGVRGNDLVGYGLVVGLNGTGDGLRNAPFTEDILSNLLERLGVNVTGEQLRPRNVAAVMVTASLQPFARTGSRVDVTVSAIGDAKSLLGGTLVMTPLNGADGQIYAVSQGAVLAGGATAQGQAASVTSGVPTSGMIPSGARVEREVEFDFTDMQAIRLALRTPDFTTAARIEQVINKHFAKPIASMLDSGTVALDVRLAGLRSPAHVISRLERLVVEPEGRARVVVDQRSGTIVLGAGVRISAIAVAQGGLTMTVEEAPVVSQPNPFTAGGTIVVPRSAASMTEDEGRLHELRSGVNLSEVVAGLNALGVAPRDMIEVLKTIHAAGALHAEFVVQ